MRAADAAFFAQPRVTDAEPVSQPRPFSKETRAEPREAWEREADQRAAGNWLRYMLNGDFEAAWRESDEIRARGAFDPHRFWTGEPLDGARVIVRCLHGLGDAIQFLRYAEMMRSRVKDLVVEVPPPLLQLAHCIRGVEKAVSWGEWAPAKPVKWQKQIEVMELPYYFRTTLSDLPLAEEYICLPDEVRMEAARAMGLSGLPRVGLVWAAGKWNPARSVPFAQFARLLDIEACEFWNLQGGAEHEAWKAVPPEPRMRDAEECGDGLLTLAAVIGEMDLVITVDTLAAHLAGAMGKPAWVLLQHTADWRWMKDRSESAWYPSLRLFRQPAQDDWGWLIARVHDELQCYLNTSIQRKNPQ